MCSAQGHVLRTSFSTSSTSSFKVSHLLRTMIMGMSLSRKSLDTCWMCSGLKRPPAITSMDPPNHVQISPGSVPGRPRNALQLLPSAPGWASAVGLVLQLHPFQNLSYHRCALDSSQKPHTSTASLWQIGRTFLQQVSTTSQISRYCECKDCLQGTFWGVKKILWLPMQSCKQSWKKKYKITSAGAVWSPSSLNGQPPVSASCLPKAALIRLDLPEPRSPRTTMRAPWSANLWLASCSW